MTPQTIYLHKQWNQQNRTRTCQRLGEGLEFIGSCRNLYKVMGGGGAVTCHPAAAPTYLANPPGWGSRERGAQHVEGPEPAPNTKTRRTCPEGEAWAGPGEEEDGAEEETPGGGTGATNTVTE